MIIYSNKNFIPENERFILGAYCPTKRRLLAALGRTVVHLSANCNFRGRLCISRETLWVFRKSLLQLSTFHSVLYVSNIQKKLRLLALSLDDNGRILPVNKKKACIFCLGKVAPHSALNSLNTTRV